MNAPLPVRQALALVYPRRCPFCDEVLGFAASCPRCEPDLALLRLPRPRLPATEHHLENLSGAAALYKYSGCVRQAILRMKNAGRAAYGECLGIELARVVFGCTFTQKRGIITLESRPELTRFDLVVPVPAAKGGSRGYNVPDYLAKPLAEALGAPFAPHALAKARHVERQEGKNARERLLNVQKAYSVTDPALVEGRRVLLVDDVITTGATVSVCADALARAGALEIFAVSVAETQTDAPSF